MAAAPIEPPSPALGRGQRQKKASTILKDYVCRTTQAHHPPHLPHPTSALAVPGIHWLILYHVNPFQLHTLNFWIQFPLFLSLDHIRLHPMIQSGVQLYVLRLMH